jgi:hypothetical protein
VSAAARYDRAALQSDPGAFPAANDRAVELARRHDYPGAIRALRQAVGANRRYALAWFNLGVLHAAHPAAAIARRGRTDHGSVHLLPIGPLDGAHVGKKGVLASAGIVGAALLVGLGIA